MTGMQGETVAAPSGDKLDSLFEWTENACCPSRMKDFKPNQQPDTLDYVFEHVVSNHRTGVTLGLINQKLIVRRPTTFCRNRSLADKKKKSRMLVTTSLGSGAITRLSRWMRTGDIFPREQREVLSHLVSRGMLLTTYLRMSKATLVTKRCQTTEEH